MATLNIRIEEETKREAKKTLDALGLDLSSAVKLFLNQVVIEQGIPFKPSRTARQIREELDKEVVFRRTCSVGRAYGPPHRQDLFNSEQVLPVRGFHISRH